MVTYIFFESYIFKIREKNKSESVNESPLLDQNPITFMLISGGKPALKCIVTMPKRLNLVTNFSWFDNFGLDEVCRGYLKFAVLGQSG